MIAYNPLHLEVDGDIKWTEAQEEAMMLAEMKRSENWWWGDFLNAMRERFGSEYMMLVPNHIGRSTAEQWVWVASKFKPDERTSLPWAYHMVVAGIKDKELRGELLANIINNEDVSLRDFRKIIKEALDDTRK